MYKGMFDVFVQRCFLLGCIFFEGLAVIVFYVFGKVGEVFGSIFFLVEKYIFYLFQQVFGYFIINFNYVGIYNVYIYVCFDSVVEKCGMYSFLDYVVVLERKIDIVYFVVDFCVWVVFFDQMGGFDEVNGVFVMCFYISGYCEYIRIEDDVLWMEVYLLGENVIGLFVNGYFVFDGVGLFFFVKSYDDCCGIIVLNGFCLLDKGFFFFFQGDGIDYVFVLNVFQFCFDDGEFGRVDYNGQFGNIGFGYDQVEKICYCFFRIQQFFIYIYVNDLCFVFYLMLGDGKSFVICFGFNQVCKFLGVGDISLFFYINEVGFGVDDEWFQFVKQGVFWRWGDLVWR